MLGNNPHFFVTDVEVYLAVPNVAVPHTILGLKWKDFLLLKDYWLPSLQKICLVFIFNFYPPNHVNCLSVWQASFLLSRSIGRQKTGFMDAVNMKVTGFRGEDVEDGVWWRKLIRCSGPCKEKSKGKEEEEFQWNVKDFRSSACFHL